MQTKGETNVTFSRQLQTLMRRAGINNAELGRAIGVSHVAVGNYVEGRVPRAEQLLRLARFFNISVEELLTDSPPQTRSEMLPVTSTEGVSLEIEQWRRRAQDAEKELSDLRLNLRELLENASPKSQKPGSQRVETTGQFNNVTQFDRWTNLENQPLTPDHKDDQS